LSLLGVPFFLAMVCQWCIVFRGHTLQWSLGEYIMPRPVAILLGLMLAALSIGFNTVRYPMIWEMVGPVKATEPTQPKAMPQAEKPENPQSLSQQAEPIKVKPMPEVGNQVVANHAVLATEKPASTVKATNPWDTQRPLVPVLAVGLSNATGIKSAGGEVIRRLPPVAAGVVNPSSKQIPNGSIPIYPTTGIE
jgi:hypothetical protein